MDGRKGIFKRMTGLFLLAGFFIGLMLLKDFFQENKKISCTDKKEIHQWEPKNGKTVCVKCNVIWGED